MITYNYDITGRLTKVEGEYMGSEIDLQTIHKGVAHLYNPKDYAACEMLLVKFLHPSTSVSDCRAIVKRYLFVLESYITVDIICRLSPIQETCQDCNQPIDGHTCKNCGLERGIDMEEITDPGYHCGSYSDRTNFQKFLKSYCGQSDPLDREKMGKHLEKVARYFADKPTEKTTAEMKKCLKAIRCPNLYDHVNLISHLYWGTPLPDLRCIEKNIMEIFDITQLQYYKLKRTETLSPLNNSCRLYFILHYLGECPKRSEFCLPKMQRTWVRNAALWRRILEYSGLPIDSVREL